METLSSYHAIVHVVILGVLLAVYHVCYRSRDGYIFNRVYLALSLLFSVLIPFVAFDVFPRYIDLNIPVIEVTSAILPDAAVASELPIWIKIYVVIALLCAFIFTLRSAMVYLYMKRRHRETQLGSYSGMPMSYFGLMALPDRSDKVVVAHEQYHVNAGHSIDRLLLGYTHCVLWWNPLIFWLRNLLIENHEVAADNASMTRNNLTAIEYLQHIETYLKNTELRQSLTLTNTYYSLIEKRAIMIQKTKKLSNRWAWSALPLFVLVFCSFTFKSYTVINTPIAVENDTIPKNLNILDTITTLNFDTYEETVRIEVNTANVKDYLSNLTFSGKTVTQIDTVTTMDMKTYEETFKIEKKTYPVELKELLHNLPFAIKEEFIKLAMEEMKKRKK